MQTKLTPTPTVESKACLDHIALLQFVVLWQKLIATHHLHMRAQGFWETLDAIVTGDEANDAANPPDERRERLACVVLSRLALVASEITGEASEAVRKQPSELWPGLRKDTLTRELADAVLRIMDLCGRYNLPLAEALLVGMEENFARPHKHGDNAA